MECIQPEFLLAKGIFSLESEFFLFLLKFPNFVNASDIPVDTVGITFTNNSTTGIKDVSVNIPRDFKAEIISSEVWFLASGK